MIDLSIVIPIKDEEDNIAALAEELNRVMDRQALEWECIWIDDGSTDRSPSEIEKVIQANSRHRMIGFEKNAGQSAALWAGFKECTGKYIATLDGDRQNDPEDIPHLIDRLEAGDVDMVNGYRRKREDSFVRKIASRIANGFRNLTTGKTVRDVGCSTRAFRRECVDTLPLYAGMHRFMPTLVAMRGFKLAEIPVNHRPRNLGTTKYTINNRLWVGIYDIFGVMWLKKRGFQYRIARKSGSPPSTR